LGYRETEDNKKKNLSKPPCTSASDKGSKKKEFGKGEEGRMERRGTTGLTNHEKSTALRGEPHINGRT